MRLLSQNSPGQRCRTRFLLGFTESMPGNGEQRNSGEVSNKKPPLNKYRGRKIACLSIKEKPPSLRGPHRGSAAHLPAHWPNAACPWYWSHALRSVCAHLQQSYPSDMGFEPRSSSLI